MQFPCIHILRRTARASPRADLASTKTILSLCRALIWAPIPHSHRPTSDASPPFLNLGSGCATPAYIFSGHTARVQRRACSALDTKIITFLGISNLLAGSLSAEFLPLNQGRLPWFPCLHRMYDVRFCHKSDVRGSIEGVNSCTDIHSPAFSLPHLIDPVLMAGKRVRRSPATRHTSHCLLPETSLIYTRIA